MKLRTAVIPVAGLGTRFLPATKAMPKEMLTVVDKPLVQYAVEEALEAGIERIIFVTGRGKEMLADHFDYAPELEEALRIRGKEELLQQVKSSVPTDPGCLFFTRQNKPLGLGHAVWCARHLVGEEPFAVILPDDLIWPAAGATCAMGQMCRQFEQSQNAMVAIMEVAPEETSKYGILDPDKEHKATDQLVRARGLVEKPSPEKAPSQWAIIGRYILMPEIFGRLDRQQRGSGNEVQLTDAMASSIKHNPIDGFRFHGTRFDCGDKVGFQMANLALALEQSELRGRLLPFLRAQLASQDAS